MEYIVKKQWTSDYGGRVVKFTGGETVTLVQDEGSMLLVKTPNGETAQVPKSDCSPSAAGPLVSKPKEETGCCAGCIVQ
jgi:hypothetical protein